MTVEETNENQELEITPTVEAIVTEPAIVAEPVVVAAPVAPAPVAVAEVETEEEELDLDDIVLDTVAVGSAHDDFDWARDKRGRVLYTADQSKQLFEQK